MSPASNTEYGCICRSKESCLSQNLCLDPKKVYRAVTKNPIIDEKRFILELQKQPLKNVSVITPKNSNNATREIVVTYQSTDEN